MIRFIGRTAVSCFALGAGLALAASAHAAPQILQYEVEHPTYGKIGTYTNIVERHGNSVEVETQLHVAVRMLGIRLFHQDADRLEHWENGRLIAFQSDTDDNGRKIDVTGEAEGNSFVVDSPLGTFTAPSDVHPSNPWSPQLLDTSLMMSTKTGKLMKVVVTDTGMVNVTFDGRTMRLHQYFVDGEKHQVVWVDQDGTIAAFQTEEQGKPIDFILQRQPQSVVAAQR